MARSRTPSRKRAKTQSKKAALPQRSRRKSSAKRRNIPSADLHDQVSSLTRELAEAREQQAATSNILRIISQSPTDARPVFDSIVLTAARSLRSDLVFVLLCDETTIVPAAGASPEGLLADIGPANMPIDPSANFPSRAIVDKKMLHLPDWSLIDLPEHELKIHRMFGASSALFLPLLRDGECIGLLALVGKRPNSFGPDEIAQAESFRDQALIAIENTRLFNELRESLEQQTATANVLGVISSSPGELQPVFEAILKSATLICEAKFAALFGYSDGMFRMLSTQSVPPELVEFGRQPRIWGPDTALGRLARDKQTVHVSDTLADSESASSDAGRQMSIKFGVRTLLAVPMIKDGELIGAINIYRPEVQSFTDKQVALVTNFAAQAVIAIENTRLLNELRQRTDDLSESLEQQTATAKVLEVISRSAFDLRAVFETVVESSARLCEADRGIIYRFDGKLLQMGAGFNISQELRDWIARNPLGPGRESVSSRAALERRIVHIADVLADPDYSYGAKALETYRTVLGVPILKGDELLGVMTIYHMEVRPFTDKQIALVETFAAQAAIAIENARLFEAEQKRTAELAESLEQQTATSEVLKVISRSAFDLQPVFDTMAENAVKLCEAERAFIFRFDGELLQPVAYYNVGPELREFVVRHPIAPGRNTITARAALERRTVHIPDIQADPEYTYAARDVGLIHTMLAVPMLKGDDLVGIITIYRMEMKPFSDKQVALVQTFAAQAVIAIENTRLLSELRESLQQQTATSDVLKVISRSTFDLQVVLNTLVESAARLCDADMGSINRQQGESYQQVASFGYSPEFEEFMRNHPVLLGRATTVGRTVMELQPVHILDVLADPEFKLKEAARIGGLRTTLGVPLLREGIPIGVMVLMRKTVRPFTDAQIALVATFADQAVIAIENVRLFEAEQQRTRELAKSLEDLQTAQDRLVQTQKLASLGQLTAGIAHEIKNPLNFVNNFSGLSIELLDELQEAVESGTFVDERRTEITELTDTLRGNLDKIAQHGKRADTIVKNMLLHSREGSGERRPVDVNAMVEESLNLAYHGARAEKQGFNIDLERSFDPGAGEVDVFPQEITRVLLNLISNGFYAATKRQGQADSDGYEPILRASTRSLGDKVEIRIRDNGIGIPPDVKEKMFNPFFTTKPAGEGTGLGLSISHDIIVKQHSGTIEVDTEPGAFTEFRIVLPRATGLR